MTDKQIIYYKKDCFNEPYCSLGKVIEQLDQLKAEKEEIKKYLGISSKTIMERLEELQEFRDNDKYKLYQAEQTLIEIKEIAKEFCNTCQEFETEKKDRNCMYCNYDDILQKIREVEDD